VPGKHPVNWFGFWVQFFFGSLFGGIIGFWLWGKSDYALSTSWLPGLIFVGGGALAMGIAAGCARDDFWRSFRDCDFWRWLHW
jgi:hypothetical protein